MQIIYNYFDEDSDFGKNKDDLKIKSTEALKKENNYSDANSENINYFNILELDEIIEDENNIEILVIVEDNSGIKYQATSNKVNEK